MERVFAVADHLRTKGKYSDGVVARERIYRPGHYVSRLDAGFVNAPLMVGNDEQYAAAMALLANKVGVPARVVLGAVVPEGGEVKGSDVSAWVELRVDDGSWRVLPTETFMDTDRPADQQTRTEEQLSGVVIPPPAQVPPPSTIDEQTDAEITARKAQRASEEQPGSPSAGWVRALLVYGGGPLLAVLVVVGAILSAKWLRRSRRRSTRLVSGRIAGAWRELVDHARDLGQPVPVTGLTRREQSVLITSAQAAGAGPPGGRPRVRAGRARRERGGQLLAGGRRGAACPLGGSRPPAAAARRPEPAHLLAAVSPPLMPARRIRDCGAVRLESRVGPTWASFVVPRGCPEHTSSRAPAVVACARVRGSARGPDEVHRSALGRPGGSRAGRQTTYPIRLWRTCPRRKA